MAQLTRNNHRVLSHVGLLAGLLALLGAGLVYKTMTRQRKAVHRLPVAPSPRRDVHLESSVDIQRPPREIYDFWRDFVQLPKVMDFLERIEPREGKVTHWVARTAVGPTLEWDSEVLDDAPGRRLSWRALESSDIQSWGSVKFHPLEEGQGTHVVLKLNFRPPGHTLGGAAAHFLSGLETSVLDHNLRNLKTYLEEGSVKHASS